MKAIFCLAPITIDDEDWQYFRTLERVRQLCPVLVESEWTLVTNLSMSVLDLLQAFVQRAPRLHIWQRRVSNPGECRQWDLELAPHVDLSSEVFQVD